MTIQSARKYEPLTETTVIKLAKQNQFFEENATLSCNEIGDGNLNLVFRILDTHTGKSIIIKQALPYAKVVGESWPLTLKRAKIEAEALKTFGQFAPQFVPEVFFSDDDLAITVMEDLSHLTIARSGFIQGEKFPLLSKHLGEYLAKTLFFTSDFGMNQLQKKELLGQFINPELCKITEDLVFTDPFIDSPTNSFEIELQETVQQLWQDEELRLQVALLKKAFLTEAEALLHGDLHTGSVFVNPEVTKVIDPEFAFYGPAGFDIGQVFANLLFQVIANQEKTEEIYTHLSQFWKEFVDQFSHLWALNNVEPFAQTPGFLESILHKYFKDSLGFAGCELIRRTIGLAHVADLDGIVESDKRIHAKKNALALGQLLIKSKQEISTLKQLINVISDKLAQ